MHQLCTSHFGRGCEDRPLTLKPIALRRARQALAGRVFNTARASSRDGATMATDMVSACWWHTGMTPMVLRFVDLGSSIIRAASSVSVVGPIEP